MEIATLLPQLAAKTASAGDAADAGATQDILTGTGLPPGIFAALLAKQLGAGGAELPVTTRPAAGSVETADDDASSKAVSDELLAELGVSPLVPTLPNGIATQTETAPPSAGKPQVAVATEGLPVQSRQIVAEHSASFADAVPANASRPVPEALKLANTENLPAPEEFKLANLKSLPAPDIGASTTPSPGVSALGVTQQVPIAPVNISASPSPTAVLTPTVSTTSAWGEALGDHVVWMVSQQQQGAELHLNPPSLGPLEIKLNMSDGQANLTFSTQHLPVKEALEAATPRLREMFGESGINLGNVSVNIGFSQQSPGNQGQSGGQQPAAWAPVAQEAHFSSMLPSAVTSLGRNNGMVDIFA